MTSYVGKWKNDFMGVGPGKHNNGWWSTNGSDRPGWPDDTVEFKSDGTLVINHNGDIFPDSLGNSTAAQWMANDGKDDVFTYTDNNDGTITLNGLYAYVQLPKVVTTGENTDDPDEEQSRTYQWEERNDGRLWMGVNFDGYKWWNFYFTRVEGEDAPAPAPEDPFTLHVYVPDTLNATSVTIGGLFNGWGTDSNVIISASQHSSYNNVWTVLVDSNNEHLFNETKNFLWYVNGTQESLLPLAAAGEMQTSIASGHTVTNYFNYVNRVRKVGEGDMYYVFGGNDAATTAFTNDPNGYTPPSTNTTIDFGGFTWRFNNEYPDQKWAYNNEQQGYDDQHAVKVTDAYNSNEEVLEITIDKPDGSSMFKSSRLEFWNDDDSTTDLTLERGKQISVEFCAKLPQALDSNGDPLADQSAVPLWPALWIMGTGIWDGSSVWPHCGEVDVMEWTPTLGVDKYSHAIHFSGYKSASYLHNADLSADYHDYKTVITRSFFDDESNMVEMYFDDHLIHTYELTDAQKAIFYQLDSAGNVDNTDTKKFGLLMNIALGGNYPGTTSIPNDFASAKMCVKSVSVTKTDVPTNLVKYGDLTNSGELTLADLIKARQMLEADSNGSADDKSINKDSLVDINDVKYLTNMLLEKEGFPMVDYDSKVKVFYLPFDDSDGTALKSTTAYGLSNNGSFPDFANLPQIRNGDVEIGPNVTAAWNDGNRKFTLGTAYDNGKYCLQIDFSSLNIKSNNGTSTELLQCGVISSNNTYLQVKLHSKNANEFSLNTNRDSTKTDLAITDDSLSIRITVDMNNHKYTVEYFSSDLSSWVIFGSESNYDAMDSGIKSFVFAGKNGTSWASDSFAKINAITLYKNEYQ